jgi:hypothetical protein
MALVLRVSPLIPTLEPGLHVEEAQNCDRHSGEDAGHQQQVHLDLLSLSLLKRLPASQRSMPSHAE